MEGNNFRHRDFTLTGVKIDFVNEILQETLPRPIVFNESDSEKISNELNSLLDKGVIEPTAWEEEQFCSNIFFRTKKENAIRIILNLKSLNKEVEYHHFKMETLIHTVGLMIPGCYMASIDLKDAYYSIPIHKKDRKYLKFMWKGKFYQFTCLPNGLAEAPRKFTKILKAPFGSLRGKGQTNSAYIDDSCILGVSYNECELAVRDTATLLDQLGFTVHPEKSSFIPSHIITYLGFVLNSLKMTVSLTPGKIEKILLLSQQLLSQQTCTIRQCAILVGNWVAAEPAVDYAPIHYKRTEHCKTQALAQNKDNFEAVMMVTEEMKEDLQWWIHNVQTVERRILRENLQYTFSLTAPVLHGAQ